MLSYDLPVSNVPHSAQTQEMEIGFRTWQFGSWQIHRRIHFQHQQGDAKVIQEVAVDALVIEAAGARVQLVAVPALQT